MLLLLRAQQLTFNSLNHEHTFKLEELPLCSLTYPHTVPNIFFVFAYIHCYSPELPHGPDYSEKLMGTQTGFFMFLS